MDIFFVFLISVIFIIIICFAFLDCDLTLKFKEKFGAKNEIFQGKTVWITGASSGIGEQLAYKFASLKCNLILTARRLHLLEKVEEKCKKINKDISVLYFQMDITDLDSHVRSLNKVLSHFDKVDILINNAGRTQRSSIIETDMSEVLEIIKLNTTSVISLTKTLLPHMIQQGGGQVVVLSSVAGKIGIAYSADYCATKAAVITWFQSLEIEMEKKGISTCIVCPGPVHSEIETNAYYGKSMQHLKSQTHSVNSKMLTNRCVELIVVAMANKLNEVWIAKQPILLFVYLATYFPSLCLWIIKYFKDWLQRLRTGKE